MSFLLSKVLAVAWVRLQQAADQLQTRVQQMRMFKEFEELSKASDVWQGITKAIRSKDLYGDR